MYNTKINLFPWKEPLHRSLHGIWSARHTTHKVKTFSRDFPLSSPCAFSCTAGVTGLSRRGGGGGEQRVAAPDPHSGLVWEQAGSQSGWLAYGGAGLAPFWPLPGWLVPAGAGSGAPRTGAGQGHSRKRVLVLLRRISDRS